MKSLKKIFAGQLARNSGWMFIGQTLTFGMQALSFVLLARLLGPDQYGVFVGAAAAVAMLAQYSSLGSGLVLIRHVSHDAEHFSEYWGNLLFITCILGVVITLFLWMVGGRLIGGRGAAIIVYVAISECTFARIAEGAGQAFQAFERLKLTAFLTTLTNVSRAVSAAVMLIFLHHADVKQWAFASLSVSLLSALVAMYLVHTLLGAPRLDIKLLFARAAEGFGFSFANSTASAYNDLDKAMLSHYGMTAANGIYSTAYKVIDVVSTPVRSVQSAAFARLCKLGREGLIGNASLMYQILRKTLPFSLACGAVLYFAAPLLPHLLGPGYAGSVSALRWLAVLPALRSIHLGTGSALTGAGYQRYRTWAQLFAALLNFGLNLKLIPEYSWLGAAWASLLTDGALSIINYVLFATTLRRERLHLRQAEGVSC